jgi:hypothetical protein
LLQGGTSRRWLPRDAITLCDLRVFVDEPAEPVASRDAHGIAGWRRVGLRVGRVLGEGAVRAVRVVVVDVLGEDGFQVPWAGDEDPVGAHQRTASTITSGGNR